MKARHLLAVACLYATPALAAPVTLSLEATIGAQRLGMQRAPGTSQQLSPMGDLGATALLRLGPVAFGAGAEGNFDGTTLQHYNASALAGFMTDLLPVLRLELLGEVGAANLRTAHDLGQAAQGSGGWDRFYGVRPGLSLKLPVLPFRVGAWGLARWGMPGATKDPELGFLARIGIDF